MLPAAELGGPAARTSSVSSSSRHGGAHSPSSRLERALVGDGERLAPPRPCRPRTRPAAGAPRSAGTRPRCRRAPRTRRAARPGRPGGRPQRRAARTRSSRSTSSPTASRTGSMSASPLTCGCSTERTGAATTRSGPVGDAGLAGVHQPAQHREPATDRVGARRQPLVRQRLPGGVERDRSRVEQVADRLDQLLGLPLGGGHGEHRAAPALRADRQAGDQERSQCRRPGQVEGRWRGGLPSHHLVEHGIARHQRGQAGQRGAAGPRGVRRSRHGGGRGQRHRRPAYGRRRALSAEGRTRSRGGTRR